MNNLNDDYYQSNQSNQSVGNRLLEELVLAEILMVEAALESAVALGSGVIRARDHLTGETEYDSPDSLGQIIRDTRSQAVEPFTVRLRHLGDLLRYDWSTPRDANSRID